MVRTRRSTRTPLRATALAAVTALALAGCGGGDPTVEVPAADETDTEGQVEEPTEEPTPPTPEETAPDDGGVDTPPAGSEEPEAGPTPDPALLEDPCAEHQGREGESFIEVLSPVAEQHATGGAVELIGCSNVFEANVQWTLYDGDGRELDNGFTTAECGSGCVGAFADSVPLDAAAGEPFAELHVFTEDAADGGRDHLTAIPLVLG